MRRPSTQMPFGRYRGHRLSALPDDYLEWLRSRELRQPLRGRVDAECRRRRFGSADEAAAAPALSPELRPIAERLVTAGYRALAKHLHPDQGGDGEQMRALNAAMSVLRQLIGEARPWAVGE